MMVFIVIGVITVGVGLLFAGLCFKGSEKTKVPDYVVSADSGERMSKWFNQLFTKCPKCNKMADHFNTIGHCIEEYYCPRCNYYFMKR